MGREAIKQIFDFREVLGTGGFGEVWYAVDTASGDDVAVKVIEVPDGPAGEEAQRLVTAEIAALESAVHENVLQLREVYRQGRVFYLVTEYCAGGELLSRVQQRLYSEIEAREVVYGLCKGLSYLHKRGIAHRDLKCENVLTARGSRTEVKIADFGLAASTDDGPLNRVCGSLLHVAPEVLRCRTDPGATYDEGVDLWSLGVLLYIIVSGRAPFQGDGIEDLARQILQSPVEFPAKSFAFLSEEVKDIISALLIKDPTKRLTLQGVLSHPWMASARATSPRQPAAWLAGHVALHEGRVAQVLAGGVLPHVSSPGFATSPPTSPTPGAMRAGGQGGGDQKRARRRSRGEEVFLDLVHSIKWLQGGLKKLGRSSSGGSMRSGTTRSGDSSGAGSAGTVIAMGASMVLQEGVTCDGGGER